MDALLLLPLVGKGKKLLPNTYIKRSILWLYLFGFLISRWMKLWQTAGAVCCASVCGAAIRLNNKFEKLDALKGDTIKPLSH